MILVDTSIWVRATQDRSGPESSELDTLIGQDVVATTDLVIAEVLQGTRTAEDFALYEERMEALHYYPVLKGTWMRAAWLSSQLRRRGIATPLADVVIATVALDNDLEVYSIDGHFGRIPNLRLHEPA